MGKFDGQQKLSQNSIKNQSQTADNNSIKSYLRSGATNTKMAGKDLERNPATTTDEKLELILSKLAEQTQEIQDLKRRLNEYEVIVKQTVADFLADKETEWSEEKAIIVKRIEFLERREEVKLKQEKKNNIIIRGFHTQSQNISHEVESYLNVNLQLDINVTEANLIRVPRGKNLIVAKLSSIEEKIRVMQNRNKLRDPSVSIANNRTRKERETQSNLNQIAEKMKSEGKTVTVGYRKLIVDGNVMIWKDDGTLLPQSPRNSSSRKQSTPKKQITRTPPAH
ncbi:hypothetical protein QAD02_021821 [Eretmocerus hayati]|uniref:Uncharacterized protein n=1 Tax=Eretmocerus hayati TaxID=131215 RepID=A0ACC2PSE5_9HYME|nr:hypothetical protein QAD02_021821 [Eretmocerus hayati]